MKGGRGRAGLHKHKWTYIVKYAKDYFGKHGFRCPTGQGELITINVGELDCLAPHLQTEGKAKLQDGKLHIDLSSLGWMKLLGSGRVTQPLIVRVDYSSDSAARKITEAGGEIVKVSS